MRILISTSTGPTLNSLEICAALAQEPRVDLTVIVPRRVAIDKVYEPSGWLVTDQEQERDGFHLIPIDLRDPRRPQKGFQWQPAFQVIRRERPEIIHVWEEPLSYGLFQFTWLRRLAGSNAKVLFYGFQNLFFHQSRWQRVLWKLTWKGVTAGALANGEGVKNLRRLGFPSTSPLERIFYGVTTSLFTPMEKRSLKAALNIDCELVVGYVGRLVPEKGLEWLLTALELLPSNIHCLVIGDGPLRAKLEQRSSAPALSGRVHFLGLKRPRELAKFMNCFDVLAAPSLTTPDWKEQFARVIAEAMACGVPVVSSDSGAIPEVVGTAAMMVPEGDTKKLAEALQYVVFNTEVHNRLIQKGLRRSEEELSVHAMSRSLIDLYRRALSV